MTEDQLYTSFRNEQTSINPCDCTSQDKVFDLKKYEPYFDTIRALFVPSLEYRIRSLLKEFVYSTNSRWVKKFPYFKKFVDAIIMWKDPLNRVVEYDIGTVEEIMRNTVKHMIKNNLITCFLDSVVLHNRLNKIYHELDALGIEDNILRSLNVWNFVNERDYLLDRNFFTDFNTTMDCNENLNTVPCNAKGSIKCRVVKLLAKNVDDRSTEQSTRSITSEYQEYQQILDSNRNFLERRDNSDHYSTCVITGSQNDSTNKINRSFNEKSCNTESKKIYNSLKLKIIAHKIYVKDNEYLAFSNSNVTRLSLPCKPNNLISRIFEADPSLTESCLIVMKRKFEDSIYNVCSCLNSVLEKLNIELTKALCLNCEIYPGYISFKLKAGNIKKYLFVARVPICQNVQKYTIQQDFSILSSSSNSSTEINESKCFEQYKDVSTNFNDTLEHIDAETEKFNTHCSQSDRSFAKEIDTSQNEIENSNEKKITCMFTENVSRYVQNLAICSCENIVEEMTSCLDNCEERTGEYCKVLNSTKPNNDDNVEMRGKKFFESNSTITKNDTFTQVVNNANCVCPSYENFMEMNNEIENIFSNKDLDSFSQTTGTNDWTFSSNKKSNLENAVCNTCSISSFVENSEYDKQLVELNCNRFSNNNINMINKRFDRQENESSLNSVKVETECNSCDSCRCDDFLDITLFNNIPKDNIVCTFETSQGNFEAMEAQSANYSKMMQMSSRNNNLLTISVQMPKSKILSKEIIERNVNTCPRTVWLTSNDDKNISTIIKTGDRCNELANLATHAVIVSNKGNKILPYAKEEIFNVKDGAQDFVTSTERFSASKRRFRFNGDSRSSGISLSTGEYLRTENHSMYATSSASLYCHSITTTSEFEMSGRRDKFQKFDKSKTLSQLRGHGYARSRNSIRNISPTTIKHRMSDRYPNNYPVETPQTILAMTKFRNSIDKIKHLIRTKLERILFNNKMSNNNELIKTCWRNKESSNGARRKKSSKDSCSVTSYSTCNCYRRSYTTSSRVSSNVILSIRRTKGKRKSEENIKFRDHELANGSKALLNFRSIKSSPWSHDLLTSTTEDIEKQKLNRNNRLRYNRKKRIANVRNCNRNSHRCDFKNSGINIISSQSTKVSLTENNSKYFKHYMCKRQEETCDNKRMNNQDQRENEQVRHEYEQYGNKHKYRDVPIKYSDSNKSLKMSLSHTWRENAKNINKQFYGTSKLRNIKKFASSRKNRQIFEKDMCDSFDDNLRKRHVFAILADAYSDYMDDLDLDFKLKLLRYVELCKNVKRSLIRTLRPDDIYEVSTTSVSGSDL